MCVLVYLVSLKKKMVLDFLHPCLAWILILPSLWLGLRKRRSDTNQFICFLLVGLMWGKSSTFEIVFGSYQKTLMVGKFLTYYLSDGWRKFSSIFEVCLWNVEHAWNTGEGSSSGSRSVVWNASLGLRVPRGNCYIQAGNTFILASCAQSSVDEWAFLIKTSALSVEGKTSEMFHACLSVSNSPRWYILSLSQKLFTSHKVKFLKIGSYLGVCSSVLSIF